MRSALKDDELDLAHGQAIGENEIRALLDQLANAIRAKDVNALMANYAADAETFDLLAPLQHSGTDAIRIRVSEWFSSFEGPIDYEMHNLSITAGDDVAFCHSLTGSSGTRKDGTEIEMWWRATNVSAGSVASGSSRTATARNHSMPRAVKPCSSSGRSADRACC
jgi:ketosteroid isomerase-like protein